MITVGIRELRSQLSEIMQQVRSEGQIVEVTYYGETIARVVPAKRRERTEAEVDVILASLDEIAAEIGREWPDDVSAVEAVREGRRSL